MEVFETLATVIVASGSMLVRPPAATCFDMNRGVIDSKT